MEPGRFQKIMSLLVTAAMVWMMLPEHQRRLTVMRLAHVLERASGRAARREGQAGMGSELGGRMGDALRRYSAAYNLSRARDAFRRVREQ